MIEGQQPAITACKPNHFRFHPHGARLCHIFARKVEDIRTTMSIATSPGVQVRPITASVTFLQLAVVKSPKFLRVCHRNPVPLIRRQRGWSRRYQVPVICNTYNVILRCAVFPASQKQAIVLPRLKESTLDPDHLASYTDQSLISPLSLK